MVLRFAVRPWGLELAGENDEALGRGTHIVKREAGDKRKSAPRRWLQDSRIGGRDDRRRLHFVLKVAVECFECDRVARSNVAQRAKESITVARENHVARLPWLRGFGDVTDGA